MDDSKRKVLRRLFMYVILLHSEIYVSHITAIHDKQILLLRLYPSNNRGINKLADFNQLTLKCQTRQLLLFPVIW